jgi:hypothetical protein
MTQDKARKAAARARMAATGEPYAEAARQLANQPDPQAVLDAALRKFGIPDGALSMVMRHMQATSEYPLLAADSGERLRVYLDLKDWVALAKAQLGRPEFPHDQGAYEALKAATAAGQVITPLSATTYQELSRHAPNATANFRACDPPCRWCGGGRRRWLVPGRGCGGGW